MSAIVHFIVGFGFCAPTKRPTKGRVMPVRTSLARTGGRRQPVPTIAKSFDLAGATTAFSRNEEVFGEGEPAEYLYKVSSGGVRTYNSLDDGRRQIAAFYLPGDIF